MESKEVCGYGKKDQRISGIWFNTEGQPENLSEKQLSVISDVDFTGTIFDFI